MEILTSNDLIKFITNIKFKITHGEELNKIARVLGTWIGYSQDIEPRALKDNMLLVYNYLRSTFPYSGYVHRGILLENIEALDNRDEVVSTSSVIGNALMFTGAIVDYAEYPYKLEPDYKRNGYLITAKVENALDLGKLLSYLIDNVTDEKLVDLFETYIYEEEILTVLPPEMTVSLVTEDNLQTFTEDKVMAW